MLLRVIIVIFVTVCLTGNVFGRDYPRQRILQDQSCYYEPYKKQLTCQCDVNLTKAFLLLKLSYNILDIGQEVRSVQIVSCPDLLLSLDLLQVNPTHIPITVRNCGVVTVDIIDTDPPTKTNNQLVNFSFNNVETVHFQRINITQGFKVNSVNVKNLLVTESEIGVLPPDGLMVTNTRKLSIRDSTFHTAYPRSIKVSGVKEVFIINNEFNINVIKVVSAEDGKRLHISCNRLIGEAVSPECIRKPDSTTPVSSYHNIYYSSSSPTTTATSNTTELSTTSTESTTSVFPADLIMDVGLSYEILIGIAAGVCLIFLILLTLVIWLCCRTSKTKGADSETLSVDAGDKASTDTNENIATSDEKGITEEFDKLLTNQQESGFRSDEDDVSPLPSPRNKFASPIWIQEIQNNKIFAKQRSINSPEDRKEANEANQLINGNTHDYPTPRRGPVKFPVRSISEILEYETLEDIDADAKAQEEQDNTNNIHTVVEEETELKPSNKDDFDGAINGKVVVQNGEHKQLLQTDC